MDKKQIRREMRRLEEELAASGSAALRSEEIFRQVEALPEFRTARTILAYMSLPGEAQTPAAIKRWAESRRIAIPRVEGEQLRLCLYEKDKLVSGYKGILEPSANAAIISAEEVDLAIIPGVAFERRGDGIVRLGHGKGFYDRLLPQLSCKKIGVGFSFRLTEGIPSDPWDVLLDDLITA